MPLKHLISWIGRQDIEGTQRQPPSGPIVDFLRVHSSVTVTLLSDWPRDAEAEYLTALQRAVSAVVRVQHVRLKDPTDYLGIFRAADQILADVIRDTPVKEVGIHTSPGTSAMAAVWILLAKTKYAGATLFERSAADPRCVDVRNARWCRPGRTRAGVHGESAGHCARYNGSARS